MSVICSQNWNLIRYYGSNNLKHAICKALTSHRESRQGELVVLAIESDFESQPTNLPTEPPKALSILPKEQHQHQQQQRQRQLVN